MLMNLHTEIYNSLLVVGIKLILIYIITNLTEVTYVSKIYYQTKQNSRTLHKVTVVMLHF
jgi:hypothetical protein